MLNRKCGYHAFHFRQFLARLKVAPDILVPVGQAAEPVALHDGHTFYGVLLPLLEPLCIFTCGNVAHSFCHQRFGLR